MSYNNTINQRSNAKMHKSEMDERYKPTKVAKGGVIYYGLPIPDTMLNDTIREMNAYKESSTKIVLKRNPIPKEKTTSKDKHEKEKPVKETPVKGKGLKAKSKKAKETEQRMIDDEIDDDLDDTLEAMKTQKMKGVAEYDIEEPQILTHVQIQTQEFRDSLDSDQTFSTTKLDFVDEGDEDDASYFTVLVHEKTMDVGLPGTTGTSGLNSHDKSSGKEKPIGDSVDPDRLLESQTVIVPEVTMTEPTGPDQHGYTREDYVLITPDETLTLEAIPRGNPKLTSCTSSAYEHPSDGLAQNLKLQMHEFITHKVPVAVQESVSAKVIQEVKNHAPTLITLTSSPALSSTNITILELKETLYKMMTNNPDSITGEKRYKKSIFASQSSIRNDQAMYDASDRDKQLSFTGKIREHPRWFTAAPAEYTDYLWVTSSDAKERFNEVVDTYPYPDKLEDGNIVPNNSTLTLAKRIKRCHKIDKLNLSKMKEFRKNRYELFRNRYISKT
ncbi:hypothetical protein Tco_1216615 [Tanacetum coccineum]